MNIFVDENIPLVTVQALRALGHDVRDIRGTADEGMEDVAVWQAVQAEKRLLVTTDRGFAAHRADAHHGILIILLRPPNARKINERALQAMAQFTPEEWPGLLIVMRDTAQSVWRPQSPTSEPV